MHKMTDDLERYDGEQQNDHKEYDRAVLKPAAACGFDAVQYPVGGKIKPDSHQCKVDDFHCGPSLG